MRTVLPARSEPCAAIPRLATFVAGVPRAAHSAPAWRRAQLALLDTIGCALQGAGTDVGRMAQRSVAALGSGEAVVIGSKTHAAPAFAALANGTAAHAKDLDDYTLVANDHPSAVLVPAVLAAATGRPATMGDLIDAYLVGLEVIFRLGAAVNMGHYNLGWHTTSTLDSLGATAAVARLWQLDPAQCEAALALTVSMGSGMVSQFGTSAKPLHAGLSAKAGVVAATLAQNGATANPAVLDGPVSLASLMVPAGAANFDAALKGLGETWGIDSFGLGAKVYPSCGYTHRSVDAAIGLHHDLSITRAEDVAEAAVSLPDFHLAILPFTVPDTPEQALFSTAWCVATALVKGRNSLDDFTASALEDPALRALAGRISVTGRAPVRPTINLDPDDPDTVQVTLTSGETATRSRAIWTGAPGEDLSEAAFCAKFDACLHAAGADVAARAGHLKHLILDASQDTPVAAVLSALDERTAVPAG